MGSTYQYARKLKLHFTFIPFYCQNNNRILNTNSENPQKVSWGKSDAKSSTPEKSETVIKTA